MKTLDFSAALHWRISVPFLSGRTTFSELSLHVRAYFTPCLEATQLWFSQRRRLLYSPWTFRSFSEKKSPIPPKIEHKEMIAFQVYGKFIFLLC